MNQTKTHIEYVKAVLEGKFPADLIVPLDVPFINENGVIQNLVLGDFTSSAIIHSKAKTIRANHYHKTDWHFSYLISGEIKYYWQEISKDLKLIGDMPYDCRRILPGQMFFTPPMLAHAMVFPVESVFITFSRNMRDHDSHESDVIRMPIVDNFIFSTL